MRRKFSWNKKVLMRVIVLTFCCQTIINKIWKIHKKRHLGTFSVFWYRLTFSATEDVKWPTRLFVWNQHWKAQGSPKIFCRKKVVLMCTPLVCECFYWLAVLSTFLLFTNTRMTVYNIMLVSITLNIFCPWLYINLPHFTHHFIFYNIIAFLWFKLKNIQSLIPKLSLWAH